MDSSSTFVSVSVDVAINLKKRKKKKFKGLFMQIKVLRENNIRCHTQKLQS